jgi:hypothetical protein
MADGVKLLLGASVVVLAILLIGTASHIAVAARPRVFLWPRVQHPDERHYAARLATLPWWLLLYLVAVNALAVLLFSEDLRGDPTTGLGLWLLLMLPPVAMVHLIDYRHSRAAALLSLVLVAGLAALLAAELRSVLAVATAAPVLLWSVNGVRATFAAHTLG